MLLAFTACVGLVGLRQWQAEGLLFLGLRQWHAEGLLFLGLRQWEAEGLLFLGLCQWQAEELLFLGLQGSSFAPTAMARRAAEALLQSARDYVVQSTKVSPPKLLHCICSVASREKGVRRVNKGWARHVRKPRG